jgi:hypothetical protein
MMMFFWTAAINLFVFQMILLYSLNRKVRIWILSHKIGAAVANLAMSVLIVLVVGVASIVGLANLFASTALAAHMIIAGRLMRKRARLSWRRFYEIPLWLEIKIYSAKAEEESRLNSENQNKEV